MGKHTSRAGFTLIELIIYIGIFSIAAGLLTGVLTTFTRVQVRESATTAVSQEAQFVIQTIQRLVTDSSLIELTKDAAVSTLKLRMPVTANDPTCIQFSNSTVYLMQGNAGGGSCYATSTSQAKTLTTSKVVVNSLAFKKFENPPATDTVKIDLTISYNSTNPQESAISRTLQTAIAKVSAATFDSDIIPSADTQYDVGTGPNRWRDGIFSRNLTVDTNTLYVDAANDRVGIGTASPNAKLQVNGVITTGAGITTGTTAGDISIPSGRAVMYSNAAASDTIRLIQGLSDTAISIGQPTTNVGIGTTAPGAYALAVQRSDIGAYTQVRINNTDTTNAASHARLTIDTGTGGGDALLAFSTGGGDIGIGIDNTDDKFKIAATSDLSTNVRLTIDSTGNVGIGVTPSATLDVNGASNLRGTVNAYPQPGQASVTSALFSNNQDATIRFLHSGGVTTIHTDSSAQAIKFSTNGSGNNALFISGGNNVGIGGLTTVTSKLQVAGGDVGLGNATATGNQPVTIWLTNASGGTRVAGEIIIIGGSDDAFTTTTTAAHFQTLGIVYDSSIANGAVGRIAIGGVVPVLSQGAVTRGNYVITSTTAGQATHATSLASGTSAIGRWLVSLGAAGTGRALIRY